MKKQLGPCVRETQSGKLKYEAPRLICYGDVATVTRGSGKGAHDMHGTSKNAGCWIAEALYGIDAPRTQLVRAWLTECYERREPWSLVVVPLYCRFGQRVAAFLRSWPVFKNVFLPLFDLGVRRAHRDQASTLLAMTAAANVASV
jgi:hypothetical protein